MSCDHSVTTPGDNHRARALPNGHLPGATVPAAQQPPPAGPESDIDTATFRAAFRRHAAGVVVITADAGPGPVGFTATSLTSASLNPPLLTFGLSTTASSWPALAAAESIVVHFLAADQHQIAQRFATSGIDRFAPPTRWSRLATGEPLLDDAPTYLRALIDRRLPVGDHHLIVARVVGAAAIGDHQPLIYHSGAYNTPSVPGQSSAR
ncbi:flavin reductase family protein [Sphaerisporangium aureirubrum]|uniref:Flavin reductase family protein n=1 Tax=Sphaerisporangium aureirubrum TaxID=1544736 RepID=A0ABW1NIU1_9ACTN